MKKTALITSLFFALPLLASAQQLVPIFNLVTSLRGIVNSLIPLLIAAALVAFFWGLVRYIWGSTSKAGKANGRSIMIAGIASLFVMISVWGIINLASSALNLNNVTPNFPSVYSGAGGGNCPPGTSYHNNGNTGYCQ